MTCHGKSRPLALAVLVAAAGFGCVGKPGAGQPPVSSHRAVITETEIGAVEARTTALQLIQRLRPLWLRRDIPTVFVNDQVMGDAPLTRYVADELREIRFLTGVESTMKYGGQFGSGAILLVTH